jgi:hypothetical protein
MWKVPKTHEKEFWIAVLEARFVPSCSQVHGRFLVVLAFNARRLKKSYKMDDFWTPKLQTHNNEPQCSRLSGTVGFLLSSCLRRLERTKSCCGFKVEVSEIEIEIRTPRNRKL